MQPRMVDLIEKLKTSELTGDDIAYIINNYASGSIPDYQVSALLMAICYKGMSEREATALTIHMSNSGDKVDLSSIPGIKVDKHSTGGVGDTTTLIAAPLAAACGVPVAKMSGRSLGHTGGTIDKLESIPGFVAEQNIESFVRLVKENGLAIVAQSQNLVPADKKLYALRDVTGTVESIPLIASSIMSKKIAAGCDAIVLDVKTGKGAFMASRNDAFELARLMVKIGKHVGKKTVAVITPMDEPLGSAVGNALEVREAVEVLKGMHQGSRLLKTSMLLAAHMLILGKKAKTMEEAEQKLEEALKSGKALEKLAKMVSAQGGDASYITDETKLGKTAEMEIISTTSEGYVSAINGKLIGIAAQMLGAGRSRLDDVIDPHVGIIMQKRVGDPVKRGDMLAMLHINARDKLFDVRYMIKSAIEIGPAPGAVPPIEYGVVTEENI